AARGTAYHRVLECLDYCGIPQDVLRLRESQAAQGYPALAENLREQLDGMIRDGKLDAVSAASVELRDIRHFLESPVGRRMTAAAQAGRLWREQPFSLAVPASELRSDWQAEQGAVLVQGIIDAYFEEEDRYVIVDYKTDKVYSRDGRDLAEKYGRQLFYYRKALEQATGREVKEMLIYSVTLGREIPVGMEYPQGTP
ncbi:MAG TPA: PD-(D/E)XK nuclease family protein, partial [Candidatus Scatomonas merdavium]|nr:PD-(D/E)XK nuclease family protein [Candidatus Scatomonas merdavium]